MVSTNVFITRTMKKSTLFSRDHPTMLLIKKRRSTNASGDLLSKKNRIIRKKTHMLKLAWKFIEKRLQHRCFPVNIGKFQKSYFEEKLRTLGSEETLGRD